MTILTKGIILVAAVVSSSIIGWKMGVYVSRKNHESKEES